MNYLYKKIVEISENKAKELGITSEDLALYIPDHLMIDVEFKSGYLKFKLLEFVLFLLAMGVKTFLLPRKDQPGQLDIEEVERVYTREAQGYDRKHHFTTRGQDTIWRRKAGEAVASYCQKNQPNEVTVLDLCTGTGLTLLEICKILSSRNITNRLNVCLTGLDYNRSMLGVAEKRPYLFANILTDFVKGNAMDLYSPDGKSADGENSRFKAESFDVVTQMCGIGGINDPKSVFEGVLKVLKPGGHFFLADMHRPVIGLIGELPIIYKWVNMPIFEALAYESTTIPLVLNQLWGWRDPTLDFYILPLVSWQDGNRFWGFKTLSFEEESLRWWLSMTLMPYAKLIVEKTEITKEENDKRQKILSLLG